MISRVRFVRVSEETLHKPFATRSATCSEVKPMSSKVILPTFWISKERATVYSSSSKDDCLRRIMSAKPSSARLPIPVGSFFTPKDSCASLMMPKSSSCTINLIFFSSAFVISVDLSFRLESVLLESHGSIKPVAQLSQINRQKRATFTPLTM